MECNKVEMTIEEIHEEAEKKFPREAKECQLRRRMRLSAKAAFIEKMLVKHGHKKVT